MRYLKAGNTAGTLFGQHEGEDHMSMAHKVRLSDNTRNLHVVIHLIRKSRLLEDAIDLFFGRLHEI